MTELLQENNVDRSGGPVLAFDTSAAHCAAALWSEGRILAARTDAMARGQAEHLMAMMEEMLRGQGLGWRDLSAVGVGIGPGNFTGIRISVSAARGLALGLGVPAVGISSLAALAQGRDGPTVAAIDARQERLYLQGFGAGAGFGPVLCGMGDLPAIANGAAVIGHRAEEIAARCGGQVAAPVYPAAEAIAHAAVEALRAGDAIPRPAPLYLRAPDAAPPRDAAPVILKD
ncbi:MAG: tRNA (adenosine(37)-N6)-threonylcarbamoyltransferase complex dimerization subunit type 1 TsaB [Alphaproteobacteria bacterium]|nr:tRNA (adenosine(37)-N6)-threonylcarbamoyltransferase complex dimerization subunit type 1 TsaB [Alphaproteobacteria bacterium]NNF24542.1 tRNA (adenosine(37)-N6)-threonylcarbamoyltransferase complex dimerization subunit type 1 TsaB [Paracoccaceae bacterium]